MYMLKFSVISIKVPEGKFDLPLKGSWTTQVLFITQIPNATYQV